MDELYGVRDRKCTCELDFYSCVGFSLTRLIADLVTFSQQLHECASPQVVAVVPHWTDGTDMVAPIVRAASLEPKQYDVHALCEFHVVLPASVYQSATEDERKAIDACSELVKVRWRWTESHGLC